MINFVNNIIKQAKIIMAFNQMNINAVLQSRAFDNIGIMIIKGQSGSQIVQLLLKGSKLENNENIKNEFISAIQKIIDAMPSNIFQYYSTQTVATLLTQRQGSGIFKDKMDQIASVLRNKFEAIAKQYSQETIEQELKNWKIQ